MSGRETPIEPPTEADIALAEKVAEWLHSMEGQEGLSDYFFNLTTYSKAGVVNAKGMGIVASAVIAYNRELVRKAERPSYASSQHIGNVGERLTFKVKILAIHESQGHFGATHIYKLLTVEGNVLTWFGSSYLGNSSDDLLEAGDEREFWVKATIKAHNVFRDVKETVVSRAAVTTDPKPKKSRVKKVASPTET